jgi:dephospho-CoA kinase
MGAGKDETAKVLEDTFQYIVMKLGKYIRKDCNKRNYRNMDERQLYQDYGQMCRKLFGEDVWNEVLKEDINSWNIIYKKIEKRELDFIIADGRQLNEFDYWTSKGFVTIGVYADEEIRKERLIKRDGKDQSQYFLHETELQAAECVKKCQYIIENNGTLDELREKVLEIAKELR